MYTIKEDPNNGFILEKDGKECFCPFQSPVAIPSQNALGQMTMSLIRMPCSSICPHAKIINLNGLQAFQHLCTGNEIILPIEKKSTIIN